ncbi:hypothetical protein ACFQRL_12260 [Microbacterium fluvii]|uniref:Uncharacterized protein n=1 Tax=Microbacterium fluvii TaxID=415215 RepID=A0ABW2HF28_9MICO|nr:hypothetical protein [Microbacterium fluvii]MCU4673370.1 hypothetical protein [Microbacterium fluvii]
MESVLLDTPAGITAKLGWDPKMTDHDRKRVLAKEIIAARMNVEPRSIVVEREAPRSFGHHTQLYARVDGDEVPLAIRTVSFRAATVAAVFEPGWPVGLDLRDAHPDELTLSDMKRHSHLFDETSLTGLIAHWTRVQAIRDADGRGARVRGEHVRLESNLAKGWIPDRDMKYKLVDLSRDGWIITLAYGPQPTHES